MQSSTIRKNYDVVIVGARCAGAATAGVVKDAKSKAPIAMAIITFPGLGLTDLATAEDGSYTSYRLKKGTVKIEVMSAIERCRTLVVEALEEGQRVGLNLEGGEKGPQATVVLPAPPDAPAP